MITTSSRKQTLPPLELTKKAVACHELKSQGKISELAQEFKVSRNT